MNKISNVDWNDVTQELNPNSAYNVFIDKICKAYNKCPLKKIKVKNKVENKPWLTQGLINATKKKRLLYEQSIRYKNKLTYIMRGEQTRLSKDNTLLT